LRRGELSKSQGELQFLERVRNIFALEFVERFRNIFSQGEERFRNIFAREEDIHIIRIQNITIVIFDISSGRMKGKLGIPIKLRSSSLSPMRFIDRCKQVLLRLLFSSSSANNTNNSKAAVTNSRTSTSSATINFYNAYYCPDSHYNEAIADCIEFFNQSASAPADDHDASCQV
jgi:hypothetical protein